ncbi:MULTISPECIES: tetratricopeptide repeat protein [unclassified Lentimicrobium]|uniref:tetratricopeptide repeat protein n=1 Tax=unclassified Lentimicrobium TaxID=2677434 RepID=UPI0015565FD6|nr:MULTISPECIES: tetratricopeptide repeat protein [unclassified Lentimicrobium]NPD47449.1 hypothetical protein [Lentimicrobium sp. S6]NPD86329.1 hypothetical protein [Lentimicrobium sp. L6]
MRKFLLLIAILFVSISYVDGQSAKKLLRTGSKQYKENQINEAKATLTHAIKLDPNMVEAYETRAQIYTQQGEIESAIADWDMVNKLTPKEEIPWLKNADLNIQIEDYKKASSKYAGYLNIETKDLVVYDKQIACLKKIEDWEKALFYAKKKLDVKETPESHFEIANLQYILKNYTAAEASYKEAIKESPNNIDYHNGLALSFYYQDRYDAAIGECNIVLRSDKSNKVAYLTRANSYHKKIEYSYAINDMSKVIVMYKSDDDYTDNLNFRGDLYLEYSQHMNAIGDYSAVINKDPKNSYALYKRAQAYEEIDNEVKAQEDLLRIIGLSAGGVVVADAMLTDSKSRLFELRRETDAPSVHVINDNVKDKTLRVNNETEMVDLNLQVQDDNKIESLVIDGNGIEVNSNSGSLELTQSISVLDKESFDITVEDVYGNKSTTTYNILRVENNIPVVAFMNPFVNENNEMILDADDSRVYFEGSITDESLIKSILIDDVVIPFSRDEANPVFSTNMDLRDKTKIVMIVTDIYDNKLETEYFLNREEALYAADSPMGKTWVVFIENSEYESFASLDGPVKDVRLMRSALANYEIHNFIHRPNMSKLQMERFFSIELRDMVKNQNVNSLVVWYAGHGKFQNETGYWIPIDADRTDEFSYFNLNNLKASMQVYANDLTHTLVITDACESGPSFYQAMRNDIEIRTCADEKAVKFKSSQVLSSAGYELASDNSQFTKTFANSLINNSEACLPIESIVLNVGEAVTKDNQQKPQFGKIDGLEDENGTFFFIKREADIPATDTAEEATDDNQE